MCRALLYKRCELRQSCGAGAALDPSYFTESATHCYQTCPPCALVKPLVSRLASQYSGISRSASTSTEPNDPRQISFGVVNASRPLASSTFQAYGVSATPSTLFFLNGQKRAEVKGANAGEVESQTGLLAFEVWQGEPVVSTLLECQSPLLSQQALTCTDIGAHPLNDAQHTHTAKSGIWLPYQCPVRPSRSLRDQNWTLCYSSSTLSSLLHCSTGPHSRKAPGQAWKLPTGLSGGTLRPG